jgi:hypothetical protein
LDAVVLGWFRSITQRRQIREDRKYLEIRVRRFLKNYLAADPSKKHEIYEVVAGAAIACQPSVTDPRVENTDLAQAAAELALKVVQFRERQHSDSDDLQSMITDAYATVAFAHRRAAALYSIDAEMQRLGTAAVHLVTMANSYAALNSPEETAQL